MYIEACLLKGNLMVKEKIKVIIDTDPGVDDAACLIYALFDEKIEIKLLTTVVGNVKVSTATRNLLHLLDLFNLDIPVAKGAAKALKRNSPTAENIHKKEGLGGYIPPTRAKHKIIEKDAIEAMYQVLSEGEGDIIPIVLGPHTNIAMLIQKHPDIIAKIPKIVYMGGSPFGLRGYPDHISFNISSDPEAFKIVLDSKIPLLMVPSSIGRRKAHLDEKYVYKMKETNDVGKLLFDMYSEYWEPNFPDKRIATNDTCALFALTYPELFKTKKIDISVDLEDVPGKTFVSYNKNGYVTLVTDAKRKKFLKLLETELKKLNHIKLNIKK